MSRCLKSTRCSGTLKSCGSIRLFVWNTRVVVSVQSAELKDSKIQITVSCGRTRLTAVKLEIGGTRSVGIMAANLPGIVASRAGSNGMSQDPFWRHVKAGAALHPPQTLKVEPLQTEG